jgi:hypothetical protein
MASDKTFLAGDWKGREIKGILERGMEEEISLPMRCLLKITF